MALQEEHPLQCPWCGERICILLDGSVPHQTYVEDCSVCCQPIELEVSVEGEGFSVTARAENR